MTAVRRYVFAFLAVCAAFAIGIALGNGPLQGNTTTRDTASVTHANERLIDQVRALRREQAFSQAISGQAGKLLLSGQLTNTSVAVFVLPGVAKTTVAGVVRALTLAGSDVTVLARLSPTLIDPAKKTYVDSVATNSLKGLKDLSSAAGLSPYARIGALLARAYTGTSNGLAVNDESRRIDAQLQGAKLVDLASPLRRRGSGVIVLDSGRHGATDLVGAAHEIDVAMIAALASSADGLVVAGPATAAQPGGLIDAVRHSTVITHAVCTLDVSGTASGQLAVAGALASAIAGQPGDYGMVGNKVVLPPALSTAR